MRVHLEGIGLCGPGLNGWSASLPILANTEPYIAAPTLIPPTTLLPANERRRAAQIVKLALAVGTEAFAAAAQDPAGTATVFASSGGDGDTIHEILSVLASPTRELSPTRFHNSVHNAAAGYWSIATRSRAAATSLCCHDDSFAAGLLEAAVQALTTGQTVALIAYDVKYPSPIAELRPIGAPFAVALILSPTPAEATIATLDLDLHPGPHASSELALPALQAMQQSTPSARSLPLLAALARQTAATVTLSYLDDMHLTLRLTPLSQESA